MPSPLSRRAFIVGAGAVAGAGALTACSSGGGATKSSSSLSGGTGSSNGSSDSRAPFVLLSLFTAEALVPGSPQRMTFAVADQDGVVVQDPPAELPLTVIGPDNRPIGAPITATPHSENLPRPYYPIEFTPPAAGIYKITGNVSGTPIEAAVQFQPSSTVPQPGQPMIPVDTPTFADPHGAELVCTRDPACPLHDVTLSDALRSGSPVAFIIATPKYCQVAICGPVLDVLVNLRDQFPGVKMVHSEVYPSDAAAQPGVQQTTEAINAYHLTYEPVLFLAHPDGTIFKRLDTIFDGAETREALTQLTS